MRDFSLPQITKRDFFSSLRRIEQELTLLRNSEVLRISHHKQFDAMKETCRSLANEYESDYLFETTCVPKST